MPWIAVVLELDMRWSSHKGYVLGMPRRIRIRCVQIYRLEFFHDVITFFGDEMSSTWRRD